MPENAKYANVKMPAAFLTPHESPPRTVELREGLRSFPGGHQGQWNRPRPLLLRCVPQRAHETADALRRAGHHRFKADEPVQVWTARPVTSRTRTRSTKVKPWDLVKGLKAANEASRPRRQLSARLPRSRARPSRASPSRCASPPPSWPGTTRPRSTPTPARVQGRGNTVDEGRGAFQEPPLRGVRFVHADVLGAVSRQGAERPHRLEPLSRLP